MQYFDVLSVVYDEENDRVEVVKAIINDDNTVDMNLHTFNPETLEWKAAEYGVDDVDELIDIILHEPFIEDVRPLQLTREDALAAVRSRIGGLKARATDTRPKAKVNRSAALQDAGVPAKYVAAAEDEPFDAIKRCCPFDPEVIAVKREHIEKSRSDLAAERKAVPLSKRPTAERVAALSKALKRDGQRQAPQGVEKVPAATTKGHSTIELHNGKVVKK